MTRVFHQDGRAVVLERRHFVGQGGEGRVFAVGELAYKLAHDPARALPAAKLAALSALDDPRVLRPIGQLFDEDGVPIGHLSAFARDSEPLCRLFAKSFRASRGVDDAALYRLVAAMREVLEAAHARGLQVGDLNPFNVLVRPDLVTPAFIDVDSWQAPGFPVTAVMDAVRDRHAPCGRFDEGTDWFAFAVTTFQLLTGLHPYRGGHRIKGLDARMKANVSALRPEVLRPPSARSPESLPTRLRAWLHAVLERGEREPLPWLALAEAAPASLAPAARPMGVAAPASPLRVEVVGGRLRLFDATDGDRPIPVDLQATQAIAWAGRAYVVSGSSLVEVDPRRFGGGTVLAVPRVVGSTPPLATRLFEGVAVQDLLGETYIAAFVGPHRTLRAPVPGVEARQIVDARLEAGMVSLLVANADGSQERKEVVLG